MTLTLGRATAEALLVSVGAPRLRRAGVAVNAALPDPELRLFTLLSSENALTAHSRYNALVRRLVSYERAAEQLSGDRAGPR